MFFNLKLVVFVSVFFSVLFLSLDKPSDSLKLKKDYTLSEIKEEKVTEIPEEQLNLVKAISSIYRNIDLEEAIEVVAQVYKQTSTNNISPTFFLGLIAHESSFNKTAKSSAGALGYTQVIPKWHKDKIKGRDIYNHKVNIQVGVRIFTDCKNKHQNVLDKAIGCYNGTSDPDKILNYKKAVYKKKKEILTLARI